MPDLLSVDDALSRILNTIHPLSHETVSLTDSLNRVIAEVIKSDIHLPPFDNSAMDGYAIIADDSSGARSDQPITLKVIMDIPAGSAPEQALVRGTTARIMTGAPIPQGATAVIPVEDTGDNWQKGASPPLPETVDILTQVKDGTNIRKAGENITIGGTVIDAGSVIRPAEIGMLAAIGCTQVKVVRKPRVVILTTGDELVDIDQPLTPGKIRDTNSYTLAGLVEQSGGDAIRLPIAGDSLEKVRKLYREALAQNPDMILSSAGVSVGTADLVKTVMQEYGNIDFWRINLRPGKPLAFGNIEGIPFFGLPGNPVSSMVTYEVFVRPALYKMAKIPYGAETVRATTTEAMRSDGRRSYNRVQLRKDNGRYYATETGTQSSGALMSMVLADGLIIIPEDTTEVPAGTELPVLLLRPIHASGRETL